MTQNKIEPPTLGDVLDREFMKPYGVTQAQLGDALEMHRNHIQRILKGTQRVTFELCVKLACLFETEPAFWIRLQAEHDAWLAEGLYKEMNLPPIQTKDERLSDKATLSVAELGQLAKVNESEIMSALNASKKLDGVELPKPVSSNIKNIRFMFADGVAFASELQKVRKS